MRRRALLATIGGGLTLAGCVDRTGVATDQTPTAPASRKNSKGTPTADAMTTDGVSATFRILGGHSPTDDAVKATFSDQQVTVTGSMDPAGCNEPTLKSVGYDAGRVELTIGETSRYSETPDVECGNASYDFRCVVTVDGTQPSIVNVTYSHPRSNNQSFTVERD